MVKKMKKPFKRNDEVKIIGEKEIYGSYSQMIKRHPQYTLRWCYKGKPDTKHLFNVLGVYRHCMSNEHDENKWCVVIQDKFTHQIFLIGEKGLELYVDLYNVFCDECKRKLQKIKKERETVDEEMHKIYADFLKNEIGEGRYN